MLYTVKDLVDFCWRNKKRNGFKKHTWEEIARHLIWAVENNKLHTMEDNTGICGVVVATFKEFSKAIYIHHIVAVHRGFEAFIQFAFERYPEYAIQGMRHGKLITFNKKHLWAIVHKAKPLVLKS